jgi:hypothetical protein
MASFNIVAHMPAILTERAKEDGDTSKTYLGFVLYYVVSSIIAMIIMFSFIF